MRITAVLTRIGARPNPPSSLSSARLARLSRLLVCVAVGVIAGSHPLGAQPASSAPVQYIDHIMIRTDDPQSLFAFFSGTLQLPIAWPLADRNGVVSGGVGFGNVNVEAIRFPGQINGPEATRLLGLALKPVSLDQTLAELRRRGVAYGAPRPFVAEGPDGARVTSFTNVTLQDFSDADLPGQATVHVFLSEYNPTYVDAVERRRRLRNELAAQQGGPLRLIRVQEVVIGTPDLRAANRNWERLVAPTSPSDGTLWRIGDGPAIRLVRAERTMIQGLVLSVASLATAREFLEKRKLLGASSETELVILPSQIGDLDIRLVGESPIR